MRGEKREGEKRGGEERGAMGSEGGVRGGHVVQLT